MKIRTSIKAIITQNSSVLFIKKKDANGYYYLLPGGGQEHNEAIPDALKRECLEEVMVDVEIGDLLFVRDYIAKNHNVEDKTNFHQVELMFACTIKGDQEPQNGPNPDPGQVGIEWIALDEMHSFRIYPSPLKKRLQEQDFTSNLYLGDVN